MATSIEEYAYTRHPVREQEPGEKYVIEDPDTDVIEIADTGYTDITDVSAAVECKNVTHGAESTPVVVARRTSDTPPKVQVAILRGATLVNRLIVKFFGLRG